MGWAAKGRGSGGGGPRVGPDFCPGKEASAGSVLLLSPDPGGFRPSQEAKDVLPLPHEVLELIPSKTYSIQALTDQVLRCLRCRPRCRQEDQEFRVISGYIGSLRPA